MIQPTSTEWGTLRGALSAPSTYAATGVHHGYHTAQLVDNGLWQTDAFHDLLAPLDPIWAVLAVLEPGGFIAPHCDKGPLWTRHHYTLDTAGWWWDSINGMSEWEPGEWVRVDHGVAHAVGNPTDKPRVHLIADTAPRTYGAELSFVRFPDAMCPMIGPLIERIQ